MFQRIHCSLDVIGKSLLLARQKLAAIQHKYRVHVCQHGGSTQGTTSVSNTMLFSTASSVDHYSNSDMHVLIKAQVNLLTCQSKVVYDVPYNERNTKYKSFATNSKLVV